MRKIYIMEDVNGRILYQSVFEKSFPQSARPNLRYILSEFGCRSSAQESAKVLYQREMAEIYRMAR